MLWWSKLELDSNCPAREMQVVTVYQARWGMTGRHLTTTQRLLESFPPLIVELNSPVQTGKVIQRPLKREDFHWEENSHRPGPIRGSSVPSRFAVPGGTNRVGAPTALRWMCWAQSGGLLFGLWLFSPSLSLSERWQKILSKCSVVFCRANQ